MRQRRSRAFGRHRVAQTAMVYWRRSRWAWAGCSTNHGWLLKLVDKPDSTDPHLPLPNVPSRIASLGFRGISSKGTPAIVPPLIPIPAGSFLMGSDKSRDKEAIVDEAPVHHVEVASFQIAKYPVTVAEYALAVRAGAVREPPAEEALEALGIESVTWVKQQQRLDHPVVCVLWEDVTSYIAWLVSSTGQYGWRLPTEAEWEKAARWDQQHSVSRTYPWGNEFDADRCNVWESGIKSTSPVGSYLASDTRRSGASPYGVEDMVGNVWEWTSSVYEFYPYVQDDGRESQSSTEYRTLRGGSWSGIATSAGATRRFFNWWDFPRTICGFRLAFTPEAGS